MKRVFLIAAPLFLLSATALFADDFRAGDESGGAKNLVLDANDTGGDLGITFGLTLGESLRWSATDSNFVLTDDVSIVGQELRFGDGASNDILMAFDDGADHLFGWDDSEGSFSSFGEELIFLNRQGAMPPVTCAAAYAGMQWMDTDTGILYVCDTSNSRNKWLSVTEIHFMGSGGTTPCNSTDPSTATQCTQRIAFVEADDMGFLLVRDITIVGGGFHADDSCTNGSGVDLEIANGENNSIAYLTDILTGCTDANGCSATGLNIDVDAADVIRARIDNNCTGGGQNVSDWSSDIIFRYRHD